MLPRIGIIGRPNVGKSSFFNMFTGQKISVVSNEPGTTRDIVEFDYNDYDNKLSYTLFDSGGLDFGSKDDLVATDIIELTKKALEQSDVILWIVEYNNFTTQDEDILKIIRQKLLSVPIIVIANKADNDDQRLEAYNLSLGGEFEYFFPVSVSHHFGFQEVKNTIFNLLKKQEKIIYIGEQEKDTLLLALVGRPNVGKSSLVNALVGKQRVMVKDMPGTTRDSIDTTIEYQERQITLIDTAGIRRLSKIGTRNIENWSVMRTMRSIKRADIVAVVVDGVDGVHQQDLSIISQVVEEQKGLIIVVNKWDEVLAKKEVDKDKIMGKYLGYLQEKFDFISWVSVIFTSALQEKRVDEILKTALDIEQERKMKRVKTSIFNEFLSQAVLNHAPTGNRVSHKPRIYYGSQVDVNPPKFVLSVNNPEHFHFSYKRYLENRIRDNFGFMGTPIIIEYQGRGKTKGMKK